MSLGDIITPLFIQTQMMTTLYTSWWHRLASSCTVTKCLELSNMQIVNRLIIFPTFLCTTIVIHDQLIVHISFWIPCRQYKRAVMDYKNTSKVSIRSSMQKFAEGAGSTGYAARMLENDSELHWAVVISMTWHRFDFDSTAIRPRYDHLLCLTPTLLPTGCAALRPT